MKKPKRASARGAKKKTAPAAKPSGKPAGKTSAKPTARAKEPAKAASPSNLAAKPAERTSSVASPPAARRPRKVMRTLRVNGEDHDVAFAPHKTLLEVLREDMGLTGTKHGCELGECGTCTVIVDGEPILSCLMLGLECDGHEITTVEGLAGAKGPHPLQTAFADLNAAQCGYCTPGFLCTSKALLDRDRSPSRETIRDALSGNLCRCTGYLKIFEAVERAAAELRGEPLAPVAGNEAGAEVARG